MRLRRWLPALFTASLAGTAAVGGGGRAVAAAGPASAPGSAAPGSAAPGSAASGVSAPGQPPAATRVYSLGHTTWIWPAPRVGSERERLGYVRAGQSLALRTDQAVTPGPGCAGGFAPVVPVGWVCLGRLATLEPEQRWLRGMALAQPEASRALPLRYALSNGTPMYRRLPARSEWEREERPYGVAGSFRPQSWGNRGHEALAEVRLDPSDGPVPWFLADGGSVGREQPLGLVRRVIPHGSMVAYTRAFDHEGRRFLLAADGTAVPADRVRPFRPSSFRGVVLGQGLELPLAFARGGAQPLLAAGEGGRFAPVGEVPERGVVALTDAPVKHGRRTLFPVKDRAEWVEGGAFAVARRFEKEPVGVARGARWLDVSITGGTLVAYEGTRPVFATLMSPGAGGVPRPGADLVRASTTPLGVYRITFKHRASTMSPEVGENRSFWIDDVPWTQYFAAPFALHTAYWHERFGEPMSAGCVNLSPEDGRWLFDWTTPAVPEGWWGAGAGALGEGTYVAIRR